MLPVTVTGDWSPSLYPNLCSLLTSFSPSSCWGGGVWKQPGGYQAAGQGQPTAWVIIASLFAQWAESILTLPCVREVGFGGDIKNVLVEIFSNLSKALCKASDANETSLSLSSHLPAPSWVKFTKEGVMQCEKKLNNNDNNDNDDNSNNKNNKR